MKGQVQAFDSISRPVKVNVKTTRYVHESWAFSSLWQVWTGIWHRYGFQLQMCPMFVQGNSLWIAHSVPSQNYLIHCCWGPLGYLDLSRKGKYSYCTYSFISHPPCSLHPEVFLLVRQIFSPIGAGSVAPIRAFLWASVCPCWLLCKLSDWKMNLNTANYLCLLLHVLMDDWCYLDHVQYLYWNMPHLHHVHCALFAKLWPEKRNPNIFHLLNAKSVSSAVN